MKKRKNKRLKRIIMMLLNLLLILICIFVGILGFLCYKTNEELKGINQELQQQNEALRLEAEQLKQTLQDNQKDTQLEESKEEQELPAVADLAPGTIVSSDTIGEHAAAYFTSHEIVEGDAVYNQIIGKSYVENEYIGLDDLRYLKVLHYNFDHQIQVGEIIVNVDVSDDVLSIFKELYDIEYEIYSMYLIDNYWTGDGASSDSASIDVNNTSAFCYREITGGQSLSNHAYGRAIDINPQQNPYIWKSGEEWKWEHENATAYIDRASGDPHVIVQGDACYSIFTKYGFSWGGNWSNPVDYQHFEKPIG